MKVEEALLDLDRVFLDTAPLIDFVERHPTFAAVVDDVFGRLDGGSLRAITSPITPLERLVVPYRAGSPESMIPSPRRAPSCERVTTCHSPMRCKSPPR